jgi:hypothetical protein
MPIDGWPGTGAPGSDIVPATADPATPRRATQTANARKLSCLMILLLRTVGLEYRLLCGLRVEIVRQAIFICSRGPSSLSTTGDACQPRHGTASPRPGTTRQRPRMSVLPRGPSATSAGLCQKKKGPAAHALAQARPRMPTQPPNSQNCDTGHMSCQERISNSSRDGPEGLTHNRRDPPAERTRGFSRRPSTPKVGERK